MAILHDAPKERLLSTREAAAASGFHQTHFNSQIVGGKLPATKDEKGRWQIKQSDLDAYLANKSVKPRRSKEFIKKGEEAKPEKSLLTQLDEKETRLKSVTVELEAANNAMKDLKEKHAAEIQGMRTAISEGEDKLARAKNRIEGLKEEVAGLTLENREHTEFLRTTIRELLQYVTK